MLPKLFEVKPLGSKTSITIPIRDEKLIAIIEENIAIAEGLQAQTRIDVEQIVKLYSNKSLQ